MPQGRFLSPWTWLGALLLAGALVAIGHVTAAAAGDDAAGQPDLLATVVSAAGGIGDVDRVAAPVADALVPAVGAAAARPLAPAAPIVQALAPVPVAGGGLPILRSLGGTTMPLGRTLRAVGGALPEPLAAVTRDVADTLPAPSTVTAGQPPQAPPAESLAPAGPQARPARQSAPAVPTGAAARAQAGGPPPGPSDPITPWSPVQPPSLPAGGPGAGGSSSLTAGFGASFAWAAVATLLLALVTLARARMAAPLALRSAMVPSRMRRPG